MISFPTMYELMIIGNPKVDSEALLTLVDRALKEVSATSVKVDRLGRKLLAYPIAGQTEGEYVVFNFDAEGAAIAQIAGKLKLAEDEVLRYLITKVRETKGYRGKGTGEVRVSEERKVEKSNQIEDNGSKAGKSKSKTKKVAVKVKGKAKN